MINIPESIPRAGDLVRFNNVHGYEDERKRAAKIFDQDKLYLVELARVGGWSTSLEFEGVDHMWNSVMFDIVERK